jgi:hypothetical protein
MRGFSFVTRPVLLVGAVAALFAVQVAPVAAADRVFELVTPADNGFYSTEMQAVSPDGTAYWAPPPISLSGDPAPEDGSFPDIYMANRGAAGWESELLTLEGYESAPQYPEFGTAVDGMIYATTATLSAQDGGYGDPLFQPVTDFYRVGSGPPTLMSAAPDQQSGPSGVNLFDYGVPAVATTPDLSALLFASADPLLPADGDSAPDVYLRRPDGLHLVSRSTMGAPDDSGAAAGTAITVQEFTPEGIELSNGRYPLSEDGGTAVFTTAAPLDPADTDSVTDLYAWVEGSVSLISDSIATSPECTPDCETEPTFSAMEQDGSRLYFTTTERLTNADIDGVADVYVYEPGAAAPRLRLASGAGSDEEAWLLSVASGGTLFFVTTSRIGIDPPAASDTGVIYRAKGGEIRTVGELESPFGPGLADYGTGSYSNEQYARLAGPYHALQAIQDPQGRMVRTTGTGDALLFATLRDQAPGDSDEELDIYLWREDAGLAWVSAGGNAPNAPAMIGIPGTLVASGKGGGRAMTDDATAVFFNSTEPLAPGAAANGAIKVYEWEQGEVSLLSPRGANAADARYAGSSADGTDVFIETTDRLVADDGDGGVSDLYSARIGGGFPEPARPPACVEDSCQGAIAPAPSLGQIGSESYRGRGNAGPGSRRLASFAKARTGRLAAALADRGRAMIPVRVGEPGTVRLTARARFDGKLRKVGFALRRVARPGTVHLSLVLSRAARRQLSDHGSLTLRMTVGIAGRGQPDTTVLTLKASAHRRGDH